jgi:ABC-type phosphate transport system substrate-binding protein
VALAIGVAAMTVVNASAITSAEPASFQVNIDGSTTVWPLTSPAAPTWQTAVGDSTVNFVSGNSDTQQPGSSAGIAELCATSPTSVSPNILDIADSSRTWNPPAGTKPNLHGGTDVYPTSVQGTGSDCTNLQPWPIGHDGIIPIANNSAGSSFVTNLTQAQIANIYDCTWTNWNQVPGASSGSASVPIVVVSRENTSGTFASFISLVGNGLTTGNYCALTGANHLVETANATVQSTVQATPNSIGYVALGFESGTNETDISVNSIHGTVTTILNGTFPLSRLLFMMTQVFSNNPRIATYSRGIDFVNFMLSSSGQAFVTSGGEIALNAVQNIPNVDVTVQGQDNINTLVDIGSAANWQRSNPGHPHWIREDVNNAAVDNISSIVTAGSSTNWQSSWSLWFG